ncbi:MAG: hypothetical protein R3D63_12305 [Paracoccaceae bacterium]
MVDIATRVHNHNWKIDPIVRSLIDTDFYKLLMCQSIFRNKPDTNVAFSLINRTKTVRLADLIDEWAAARAADHVRSLPTRGESTLAARQHVLRQAADVPPRFHGVVRGPAPARLSPEKRDGQYELTFEGKWPEVMLWEIRRVGRADGKPRSRAVLRNMGKFELQVLCPRHGPDLGKGGTPARDRGLKLADFGTRRRHGSCGRTGAQALQEGLGAKFTGTRTAASR